MVASRHFTRIDTQELRDVIFRKIGSQRADKYFHQLQRFLGCKLSKSDLDKSCLQTLGRENIPLHNRLIRAILYNSCHAGTPSQKPRKVEGLGVRAVNGYQRSCFQSLYGDGLPSSPRKSRSPINRERKFRDRPSPLGPLGKSPSLTCEETVSRIQEQSAAELQSSCSKPPRGEEGEEVEQVTEIPCGWRSITPPYGVPLKFGAKQKNLHPISRNTTETCQSSGFLPDTVSLMSRLEMKLASEAVTITPEAANAVNQGLNIYLRSLLQSAVHSRQRNGHMSMLDFQVAMEMNPSVLGENWPTQLEKISHCQFQ